MSQMGQTRRCRQQQSTAGLPSAAEELSPCQAVPKWQSPRIGNLASNRDPIQTALCSGCWSEIPERRRNMRPNAQRSVKDGLTITRYWLARSASSAVAPMPVATRRCPHYRRVDTADWPSTSGDIFRSLPRSRKSLSRHTFRSTSPAREALLSMSTAPPGSPPAWLRAPGLWWCKHREGRCGSRG